MESRQQQTLRHLKTLAARNRATLQALNTRLLLDDALDTDLPFHQIRQQYDLILAASKQSIDRNTLLQQQLESRQQYAHQLHWKLQKQTAHIQDLSTEMDKATGTLRKERKSMRMIQRGQEQQMKLESEVVRLNKRLKELQKEEKDWTSRESEQVAVVQRVKRELDSLKTTEDVQIRQWKERITELQSEIQTQKEVLSALRESNRKSLTPQKKSKQLSALKDMKLMIRKSKEQLLYD